MKPYFSVIIPLYNKENFILNTLKSALNQTFTDYEIIIIEDCSSDKSLEIVSKVENDKIRIIKHEKNKGLSASRNTGIKNANANYLAFLDADDLWKENYLQELFQLINDFPEAHLFATNYEEFYSDEKILLPENNAKKLKNTTLITDFFEISLAQPLYCPSSFCVEKSVFETVGLYDETITFGEDVDFNIRANSEFLLAYSKSPLVHYLMMSENQITQSKISGKIITNFDKFETKKHTKSVKKFLDFHRYIMAKHYKLEGNNENFRKMKNGISTSSLNNKQLILLHLPSSVLKFANQIKALFLSKGIRFTTYD
jgi:glycosyltransferase involved in cell wall biosynthesis